ncbi:hypothetical protein SZ64_15500 [Erythrobacter sp. SG61-1L]|uniref:hypothetical protein n=1 Tax=Erythrobacter sp. SG61-1L TaxID=1603897 RepID=UPI0006C92AD1|nr:hypothetical protein [Erythrobacter sp. SG61-1L]KPL69389.1 hypothetical protein SZ64_15500 [Erythrobacter sp. SG61-1L]
MRSIVRSVAALGRVAFCLPFCAGALALLPAPALACSVGNDYRVPTNLELAGDADLILLGKVTGGSLGMSEGPENTDITVEPIRAIKGDLPGEAITLRGLSLSEPRFLALSNPYELVDAHPLSYIGGCIRYMFPLGTRALFFLKRGEDGDWQATGRPFSRWAEDVPDEDAPWVRLSTLYAQAAALPDAERTAMLERARDEWAAMADDPVAQLLAANVTRQLAGQNEPWNLLMQRELGLLGYPDEQEEAPASVDAALEKMRGTED